MTPDSPIPPATGPASAPRSDRLSDDVVSRGVPSGSRALLRAVALLSLAALSIALVAQHAWGMQPCPWCVLQRLVHVAIVPLALLGCLAGPAHAGARAPVRAFVAFGACALAVAGIAAAAWQGFGPGSADGCALTLADRIVNGTGLAERLPSVFSATASCDEANLPLLGIPFAVWSIAIFALSAVLSGAAAWAAVRGRLND